MQVLTHEAFLLSRIPTLHRVATLDDIHRHAWSIFTRDGSGRTLDRRPFIFRFEPTGNQQSLLIIRSSQPFHGSIQQWVEFRQGQSLTLDLTMIPTRRRKKQEYTPHSDQWPALWSEKLAAVGFRAAEDGIKINLLDRRPWNADQRTLAVINGRATGTIVDAAALAQAWLTGVGRRKAYGLGLLRIAPSGNDNNPSTS